MDYFLKFLIIEKHNEDYKLECQRCGSERVPISSIICCNRDIILLLETKVQYEKAQKILNPSIFSYFAEILT